MEDSFVDSSSYAYEQFSFYSSINMTSPEGPCDSHNRIDITEVDNYVYTGYQLLLHRLILPLILTFGLLTNLAFIFVVARVQAMRTVINQYLVHLAVADVVFLVGWIGSDLWFYRASPLRHDYGSPGGSVIIIISVILTNGMLICSELLVTAVAFQECYAIRRPRAASAANPNGIRKVTIVLWSVSLGIGLSAITVVLEPFPICFKWPEEYNHLPSFLTAYTAIDDKYLMYHFAILTVPFFVLLIINSILTVCAKRSLRATERYDQDVQTSIEAAKQLSQMLVANGIAFFLMTAPFQVRNLFYLIEFFMRVSATTPNWYRSVLTTEIFYYTSIVMLFLNSSMKPMIYCKTNSRYREAFKEAFCQIRCKNETPDQHGTPEQSGSEDDLVEKAGDNKYCKIETCV